MLKCSNSYLCTTEAFVVRNLGGRIAANLEVLLFIETFTQGKALKDIVIIHHFGK
jgi:carbonic anhydrase